METHDSPTMLDALAAEAKDIMDLQAQASRISIEATRKAGLLWKQINAMADLERQRVVDPDHVPLKRDGVLNAYAQTDKTPGDIGDDHDLHWRQVDRMIRRARKEGDPRAAQGDLLRQPPEAAQGDLDALVPHALPEPEPASAGWAAPVGGPLCELDLDARRVTFEFRSAKLLRIGFRIVHFLNDREPKSLDRLLKHLNLTSKRSLDRELRIVLPEIEAIGLTIKELLDSEYQLQPTPSA